MYRMQHEILFDMGWMLQDADDGNAVAHQEMFHCDDCGKGFKSPAAVAVHQQRFHGERIATRRFACDSICRVCCKCFHTRPRLLTHWQQSSTRCWIEIFRR